jgi:hypothetical protein
MNVKRVSVLLGIVLTALAMSSQLASAQTPPPVGTPPSAVATTPAITPTTAPAMTPEVTPTAATTDSMTVTALIPAAAGTTVRVEALDLATNKPFLCTQAASAPVASSSSISSARFVIDQASCVAAHSGTLRICWSGSACSIFFFQPGKTVDLGLLSGKPSFTAPNTGSGLAAETSGSSALAMDLRYAAVALFALGLLGIGASALAVRRRGS